MICSALLLCALGCDSGFTTSEAQQGARARPTNSAFALDGYHGDALCERIEEVARDRGNTLSEVRRLAAQASCETPLTERAYASVPELMKALYQTISFRTGSRTLAALAYDSDSPQPASAAHPRLILFDGFQTLMGVQANYQGALRPQQINNNTIELLHYDCLHAEWRPYLIREEIDANAQPCLRMYDEETPYGTGQQPLKTHCQHCHAQSIRPIWDDIPLWPKLVGAESKAIRSISFARQTNDNIVFSNAKQKSGFYDILNGIEQTIKRADAHNVTDACNFINGQIGVTLGYLQAHRIAHKLRAYASRYEGKENGFLRLWASLAHTMPTGSQLVQNSGPSPGWSNDTAVGIRQSAAAFIEQLCGSPWREAWCSDPQALHAEFQQFAAATPNKDSEPRSSQSLRAQLAASDQAKVTRALQAYAWAFEGQEERFSVHDGYSTRVRWVEEAKWAFLASKLHVPEAEVHSWFHVLLPLREGRVPWDIQTGDREVQHLLAGHLNSWLESRTSCD